VADTDNVSFRWWFPLWEFLIHVTVGTGIFVLIGTPAIMLDRLIHWLSTKNISIFIIYGLKFSEYTLFIADIILFFVFIARTAWRTLRRL